jgi:hypothetical protein
VEEARSLLTAVKQGNRASEVIGRIRSLFRHGVPEYVELDIMTPSGRSRADGRTLRGRTWSSKRSCRRRCRRIGDRVQLQQVVLNHHNSADAIAPSMTALASCASGRKSMAPAVCW